MCVYVLFWGPENARKRFKPVKNDYNSALKVCYFSQNWTIFVNLFPRVNTFLQPLDLQKAVERNFSPCCWDVQAFCSSWDLCAEVLTGHLWVTDYRRGLSKVKVWFPLEHFIVWVTVGLNFVMSISGRRRNRGRMLQTWVWFQDYWGGSHHRVWSVCALSAGINASTRGLTAHVQKFIVPASDFLWLQVPCLDCRRNKFSSSFLPVCWLTGGFCSSGSETGLLILDVRACVHAHLKTSCKCRKVFFLCFCRTPV